MAYDVVKTYVTEKIGDLTGLEVMATCPRSSQSKIRKRNTGNGVSFGIVDLHKEVEKIYKKCSKYKKVLTKRLICSILFVK
ncbi:hypothetical protein M5E84_11670 [[Ruminococcus] torques]|nr:hypothetical protein M5E84_11670 [[Ruminococcus] torques]